MRYPIYSLLGYNIYIYIYILCIYIYMNIFYRALIPSPPTKKPGGLGKLSQAPGGLHPEAGDPGVVGAGGFRGFRLPSECRFRV